MAVHRWFSDLDHWRIVSTSAEPAARAGSAKPDNSLAHRVADIERRRHELRIEKRPVLVATGARHGAR
jgi:hypothetical protein